MYDLSIIGAGWAGFNAALKAKELCLKTCLIERSLIGGTCLNLGCIPTKSLIQSAKGCSVNFTKIQERKENIVAQLRTGMQFMLRGIDIISGSARINSNNEVTAGNEIIESKNILIASGSTPYELNQFKFDGKKFLSSNEILKLTRLPGTLLIVGGGVIGCEFASLFHNLGVKVTIAEKMPHLLPGIDTEVSRRIEAIFKKKGIKVNLNTDASTFNLNDFAIVLICVGRAPNTQGLGLEELGMNLEKGRIIVDDYLRTNIKNIYAAGDCASKIMLAHYAAYQGIITAENIFNPENPKKADNNVIPGCVFTTPEIASVGLSEDEAKIKNIKVKIRKFDFLGLGMARIMDETEGFIKIISDSGTDMILGGSIIGPRATELIAVLTMAITNHLKAAQIKDTIFAHPTLSEVIPEALR